MNEAWYALRLQAISAVAWLVRIPLSEWSGTEPEWEDDGGAPEDDEDEDETVEDNPHLTPAISAIIRRSLDSTLTAVWPAAHQELGQALLSVEFQLTYQLHLFNSLTLDTLKGAAWELSKLFYGWLPEDTDASSLIGADWATDESESFHGKLSVKAEMYAFIAEALEGNHAEAVQIVETTHNRFTSSGLAAGVTLLAHLLVSLAHRYSLNEIPGLAGAFVDDEE